MPTCATCGGYVSPDFVRVFGDNDRTVRSCLACHGAAQEPTDAVDPDEPKAVEVVASPSPSSEGLTTEPDVTTDDEDGTSVEFDDVDIDIVEPETPSAEPHQSRFGFLRSVFLK